MNSMRINEAIDFNINSNKNWKYDFKTMTKRYGREFIIMLKAMWESNCGKMSEEKFCEVNGIPMNFFEKTIKEIKIRKSKKKRIDEMIRNYG